MKYYEDWTEFAACRSVGGEPFYPEKDHAEEWRQARKVCRTCPVLWQCTDSVMKLELGTDHKTRYGVWAAMSPLERKRYEPLWLAEQAEEQVA
jgi:hypothetical protein